MAQFPLASATHDAAHAHDDVAADRRTRTFPGARPTTPVSDNQVGTGDSRATQATGTASRSKRSLGVAAILASATAMGTAGMFGRMASPPEVVIGDALTLGRMIVGSIGILVILIFTGRMGVLARVRISPTVVLGGAFLGLSLALMLSASMLTGMAVAVALLYLGPVLATVLARVVLKESPSRAEAVTLGAAFVGMILVAGLLEGGSMSGSGQQSLGVLLGAGSGILYGAALLCYRFRTDMPADVRSFWNFTFAALATAGLVAFTRPDISAMTAANWTWAITFFIVCGLGALSLLVLAGQHLRTAELSRMSYWEVVVALLLGAAIFGEEISPLAGLGAIVITAAAALPLLTSAREGAEKR